MRKLVFEAQRLWFLKAEKSELILSSVWGLRRKAWKSMQTLRKFFWRPKLFILPLLILSAIVYSILSGSSKSSDPSDIDALAPVEVLADGFQEPTGVVVDPSGAGFVSDRKAGGIFKINGEAQSVIASLKRPAGLAFDGEGKLLIVEEKTGKLLRLESNGNLTTLAQWM